MALSPSCRLIFPSEALFRAYYHITYVPCLYSEGSLGLGFATSPPISAPPVSAVTALMWSLIQLLLLALLLALHVSSFLSSATLSLTSCPPAYRQQLDESTQPQRRQQSPLLKCGFPYLNFITQPLRGRHRGIESRKGLATVLPLPTPSPSPISCTGNSLGKLSASGACFIQC